MNRISYKLKIAKRAVKFWWQRRTRNWSDDELWNLDHSLAKVILPRLLRFKKLYSVSHVVDKQWGEDLDTMINAFTWIASDDYWSSFGSNKHIEHQKGLDLFAKNYYTLWD